MIRNFIKKYKLIIFLVALIFVLAFIKNYFGNKTETGNNTQRTEQSSQNDNKIENSGVSKTNEELKQKYDSLTTDEEKNELWETLSEEQQTYLSDEESVEEYNLEDTLPYESDTFIARKYATANVLVVKAKGDNFDKSKSDVKKWLEETADNPDEIILVWED